MKTRVRLFRFFLMNVAGAAAVFAQGTPLISRVNVPQANEQSALSVSVEFAQSTGVAKILLHYRAFGETDYQEVEMLIAGRTATATIPAEAVLPPNMEYYIEAQLSNGNVETYPLQNAMANPQRVAVKARDLKDDEIRILSPEPGETVDSEELVVAISFFFASENVNPEATKIFVDDTDVTSTAVFSDDLMLYSPASAGQPLSLGAHRLRIEVYDKQGNLYHTVGSSFSASTAAAIAEEESRTRLVADGQLEFRNENLKSVGSAETYLRGDLRLSGATGILNFGGSTHIDNQEDPKLQPQNRFLGYASTDFLSLQVGDAYPRFPSYIVSGKRVRGLSANLMLGFFNVDFTMGETNLLAEGTALFDTTYADSSAASSRPSNAALVSGLRYTIFDAGTFQRDFFAIRPSFGSGQNFQLGFTYMKAKDKVGSVKYGTFPQENLVVGSDLMFAFDDQKIKFESQASIGIKNTDISNGSITDAELEALGGSEADDIKEIRDIAETFITINQHLSPVNPFGTGEPALSYEATLSLNYLNNYIRGTLFKRGASYSSFGNEFLQVDYAGVTISDRIRMFDNKVFLSVSYDARSDNTAETKPGTTDFNYLNTSVTIVPGANLPSFTLGYANNSQLSDYTTSRLDFVTAPISSADSVARANERTNAFDNTSSQIYLGTNFDFEAGAKQSLTLNLSLLNREDKTFFKRDQSNLSFQAALVTSISPMLQTTVAYLLSQNETQNQVLKSDGLDDGSPVVTNLDYSAASVGALLRLMDERLQIQASLSPTFGSINRTIARVGLDYAASQKHTFMLLFDFIQNAGLEDDTIGSVIYRFAF